MAASNAMPQYQSPVTHWDELKAYIGFDDAVDGALLRNLLPHVEERLPDIVGQFYDTILRFPGARSVFRDTDQIERLMGTMHTWCTELLSGPWDHSYLQRRQRIGRAHVRVRLPERYMFGAMNNVRRSLDDAAWGALAGEELRATVQAIARVTDLDLAVMVASYWEAHEVGELRTLQEVIVQNLPITVLCLGEDGLVSTATQPLAGTEDGTVAGRPIADYLPEDLPEAAGLYSHVADVIATGQPVEIPRITVGSGPSARHYSISLQPTDYELARVLIHVEDLTEAIRAEARVRHAESLARIGSLAANVAHEIRNPLTAISTTLQVIGTTFEQDDRRKAIMGKVQEQVLRLDRLVSDLLGYARPAQAHIMPSSSEALAREAAATCDAAPRVEVLEDTVVMADPQLVQHILINLLVNARDACPTGLVRLVVGPGASIHVVDEGPGVALDVLAALFEPFVTTKARGTGLGLAICRKYAESMGGSVDYAPASPGARFVLTLRPAPRRGRAFPTDSEEHSG